MKKRRTLTKLEEHLGSELPGFNKNAGLLGCQRTPQFKRWDWHPLQRVPTQTPCSVTRVQQAGAAHPCPDLALCGGSWISFTHGVLGCDPTSWASYMHQMRALPQMRSVSLSSTLAPPDSPR